MSKIYINRRLLIRLCFHCFVEVSFLFFYQNRSWLCVIPRSCLQVVMVDDYANPSRLQIFFLLDSRYGFHLRWNYHHKMFKNAQLQQIGTIPTGILQLFKKCTASFKKLSALFASFFLLSFPLLVIIAKYCFLIREWCGLYYVLLEVSTQN